MILMSKEHPTMFICIKILKSYPLLYYVFYRDRRGKTINRVTYNKTQMKQLQKSLVTMFNAGYVIITEDDFRKEILNALDQ